MIPTKQQLEELRDRFSDPVMIGIIQEKIDHYESYVNPYFNKEKRLMHLQSIYDIALKRLE